MCSTTCLSQLHPNDHRCSDLPDASRKRRIVHDEHSFWRGRERSVACPGGGTHDLAGVCSGVVDRHGERDRTPGTTVSELVELEGERYHWPPFVKRVIGG